MSDSEATPHAPLSRRTFMLSTAARPVALAAASPGQATVLPMTLRVNGSDHALNLDPRTALPEHGGGGD